MAWNPLSLGQRTNSLRWWPQRRGSLVVGPFESPKRLLSGRWLIQIRPEMRTPGANRTFPDEFSLGGQVEPLSRCKLPGKLSVPLTRVFRSICLRWALSIQNKFCYEKRTTSEEWHAVGRILLISEKYRLSVKVPHRRFLRTPVYGPAQTNEE